MIPVTIITAIPPRDAAINGPLGGPTCGGGGGCGGGGPCCRLLAMSAEAVVARLGFVAGGTAIASITEPSSAAMYPFEKTSCLNSICNPSKRVEPDRKSVV